MSLFTKKKPVAAVPYDDSRIFDRFRAYDQRFQDLELRFSQLQQWVTDEMIRSKELRQRASNDKAGDKRTRAREADEATHNPLEALRAQHPGQDGF